MKTYQGENMTDKQINLSVDDGDAFFAHEVSINFNPTQFMLDFKCITPRVDPRIRDSAILKVEHNVVMMEPFHLKKLNEFISTRLKDYEHEFGRIEEPKQIKMLKKKHKDTKKEKETIPSYLG